MYWKRKFWVGAQMTIWTLWKFGFCCSVSHSLPLRQKGRSLWGCIYVFRPQCHFPFPRMGSEQWISYSSLCSSNSWRANEHGFAGPLSPLTPRTSWWSVCRAPLAQRRCCHVPRIAPQRWCAVTPEGRGGGWSPSGGFWVMETEIVSAAVLVFRNARSGAVGRFPLRALFLVCRHTAVSSICPLVALFSLACLRHLEGDITLPPHGCAGRVAGGCLCVCLTNDDAVVSTFVNQVALLGCGVIIWNYIPCTAFSTRLLGHHRRLPGKENLGLTEWFHRTWSLLEQPQLDLASSAGQGDSLGAPPTQRNISRTFPSALVT